MTTAPLLEATGLRAGYGPATVLHGVSLTVGAGEIVAVIGGNGAGKTTTMACIAGLLAPRGGTVRLGGEDITGLGAHRVVRRGLALVPEGRRIFPHLSVDENLMLGAWTRTDRDGIAADRERAFALFPILAGRRGQAGGTLSGGEQQMLALARALMARPRVLLLDEPSMGVAPLLVERILDTVRRLNREQGLAVLLVEQNARQALRLAHRAYVLEHGAVALEGPAEALLADPRVRGAYLGG